MIVGIIPWLDQLNEQRCAGLNWAATHVYSALGWVARVGEDKDCLHPRAHQGSRVKSQTRTCGTSRWGGFACAHSLV